MLSLNSPMETLDDGISIIRRLSSIANLKCTRQMLSIILPETYYRCFIVAFQVFPEFFPRFTCNYLHYAIFSLDDLHTLILDRQRHGFSSLTISVAEKSDYRVVVAFEFYTSGDKEKVSIAMLPAFRSINEDNVGEIDYTYFVSIDMENFKRLVKVFGDDDDVRVVMTNSQIEFYLEWEVIVLTTVRKECIIGGIAVDEKVETFFSFNPMHFFYNFKSKRVWFFKSNDKGIMLTAPMGLHARISSYFPDRL